MTFFDGAFQQPDASDEAAWRWEQQMQQAKAQLAYRGVPATLDAISVWQDAYPGEPLPSELAAYDLAMRQMIADEARIDRELAADMAEAQVDHANRVRQALIEGEMFADAEGVVWYRSAQGQTYCSVDCFVDNGCQDCTLDWEREVP